MEMDYKDLRNTKSLKIERVFETSRLAVELISCAYENIVPISRKTLNMTKKIEPEQESWPGNKEEQKCVMVV